MLNYSFKCMYVFYIFRYNEYILEMGSTLLLSFNTKTLLTNVTFHCCVRGYGSQQKGNVGSERKPTKYPVALNSGMHRDEREYAPLTMNA